MKQYFRSTASPNMDSFSNRSTKMSTDVAQTSTFLTDPSTPPLTGMKKWYSEYAARIPDTAELQREINQYMDKFDSEEREAREQRNVPDEDGWITVNRTGKKAILPLKAESLAEQRTKKKRKLKKADQGAGAFYSFQVRDSKLKHLESLRAKFEEDKRRLSVLRSSRKFRPT